MGKEIEKLEPKEETAELKEEVIKTKTRRTFTSKIKDSFKRDISLGNAGIIDGEYKPIYVRILDEIKSITKLNGRTDDITYIIMLLLIFIYLKFASPILYVIVLYPIIALQIKRLNDVGFNKNMRTLYISMCLLVIVINLLNAFLMYDTGINNIVVNTLTYITNISYQLYMFIVFILCFLSEDALALEEDEEYKYFNRFFRTK